MDIDVKYLIDFINNFGNRIRKIVIEIPVNPSICARSIEDITNQQ